MNIQLLADENFPLGVIKKLKETGYDVLAVALETPGINDYEVLDLARRTGRRLLTFDSDFGDLVFARNIQPPIAILYLRIHPIVLEEIFEATLRGVKETPDGYFAVITMDSIRLRAFPSICHPK